MNIEVAFIAANSKALANYLIQMGKHMRDSGKMANMTAVENINGLMIQNIKEIS